MKNRKVVFMLCALAAVLLICGCASEVRYSPSEITRYSPDIQEKIRAGQVAMGMDTDQVRYAWGAPTEINVLPPAADGKSREEWVYKDSLTFSKSTLVFTDGKVSELESSGLRSKNFEEPGH
jgi:hypothetical protein